MHAVNPGVILGSVKTQIIDGFLCGIKLHSPFGVFI